MSKRVTIEDQGLPASGASANKEQKKYVFKYLKVLYISLHNIDFGHCKSEIKSSTLSFKIEEKVSLLGS